MKNKLKPINTLSLVDRVEENLKEYFETNNLKPGDSIPKEIEIAESLGVSRTVVREAVLRLRTLGLIESKKHSGMILTEPDILNGFGKVLNPKMLGNNILKDIFELRLILEVGMADLLFKRKNDQIMAELDQIVKRGEDAKLEKLNFSLKHEIEFHGKLYEISENNTLLRFQSMLLPVFKWVHENHYFGAYEYKEGFVTHRDLYNILHSGTPNEFRIGMRRHLEPHFERALKKKA